jgi:hypothetical protein
LNLLFAAVAVVAVGLHRAHVRSRSHEESHEHGANGLTVKRVVVYLCIAIVAAGLVVLATTAGR